MKLLLAKKAYASEIKTGKAPTRVITQEGGAAGLVELVSPLRGAEAQAAAAEALQSADPIGSMQSLTKSLSDRELRYMLASYDHKYFALNYLKKHFSKPIFGKHHGEIFAQQRKMELQERGAHFMIVEGGRELGKSSIAGLLEPVRLVVVPVMQFKPDGIAEDIGMQYLLFIGATLPNIKETMSNAYKEFEDNDEIKNDFGVFYRDEETRKAMERGQSKDEWSKTTIITNNGRKFRAFAKHGSMRSVKWRYIRPQFVYAEDLDGKDKDSKSMTAPVDDFSWFINTLLPALDSDKYGVSITGNDVADNTCIHMLIEHGIAHNWWVRKYPLYWENEQTGEREYIWPEYYGEEYLKQKADNLGDRAVAIEYGGKRLEDATSIKESEVHYYKPTDISGDIGLRLLYFGGMDPAFKDKKTSDFTALQNIAYDPVTRVTYVLPPYQGRPTQAEKIKLLVEQYVQWNWTQCGIEDQGFQYAISESVKDALIAEHITCADDLFVPITTGGVRKETRIARLFHPIKEGRILFLKDNKLHQETIRQMVYLESTQHDDLCDSLEIAARTKDEYMKKRLKNKGYVRVNVNREKSHEAVIRKRRVSSAYFDRSDNPRDPGYDDGH